MLVYRTAAAAAASTVVVETPLPCWNGQNRRECSEGALNQILEHIEKTKRSRVKKGARVEL
jgi:hypothetical protein